MLTDTSTAWKLLQELPAEQGPALILLDLNLPGETGCDFLRKLKHNPCYTHTPIVILTTSDDPADIRSCYEAGASGYVIKPGCFEELVTQARHIWKFWIECNCPVRVMSPC
jgi:CheY-like chemotaxis protein